MLSCTNYIVKLFLPGLESTGLERIWALAGVAQWIECWPANEPKGCWFYSQSGYMPALQARSPFGGAQEATTHCCFSPSLSSSLSLKIKKLKLKKIERVW